MNIPLVDLTGLHRGIRPDLERAFGEVLGMSAFIQGPFVAAFESEFARAMGARHCAGAADGTVAISLALRAAGIVPGDEVIVPANTYVATAEAVAAVGATPVFADVREDDFHMDVASARRALTSRTRALIPVHLYGLACDMGPWRDLAREKGLKLIGDAAQAHLATCGGKSIAQWADVTCTSFYPGKNLGALGDGGAVLGDDDEIMGRVRLLADHGSRKKYHHEILGGTERLDGLQAAFLSVKLKHLEEWTRLRREAAALYGTLLKGSPVKAPASFQDRSHVYHLYVVRVPERDRVLKGLQEAGVGAGIHYPFALTQTPSTARFSRGSCPVAEKLSGEILSLPLCPMITRPQQEKVVATLLGLVRR